MKAAVLLFSILLALNVTYAKDAGNSQVIDVIVTEKGFEPSSIDVKADQPIVLKVTRKTDSTCATEIQIPSKKVKKDLPLNETVSIDLGKVKKGDLNFACAMNMIKGQLHVK